MKAQMLEGKIALITGSSYGMGKDMAKLFAEEGASIIMTGRRQDKLDKAKAEVEACLQEGRKVITIEADTRSKEDTERVFDTIEKEFGDLDILINNAGFGEQTIIDDTEDELILDVLNTNVAGPIRYCRQALNRFFLPKNEGAIVNISSVNGRRPICGASYTASKGGVNTLTLNLAIRTCDTNIRVNAVAPGSTITPAHLINLRGEQPGGTKMVPYATKYYNADVPDTQGIDQAYACLYLASDMGKCVTGQIIQVCNGSFL